MSKCKGFQCPRCFKKGPFIGGYSAEDESHWFLLCLLCGHSTPVTKKIVKQQIKFQQMIGGHKCPNCGLQVLSKGSFQNNDLHFTCTNCGFVEIMTPDMFETYRQELGKRLNIQ